MVFNCPGDGDGRQDRGGGALAAASQAEGQVQHAEGHPEPPRVQQQPQRLLHLAEPALPSFRTCDIVPFV